MPRSMLDTNVLVHAAYMRAPLHAAAVQLIDRGMRQRGQFCIAPQVIVEFAAVLTRPRQVAPAVPATEVARMVEKLYASRRLEKVYPARGTVIRAIRKGAELNVVGPRWYDLFLAVTMADAGVQRIVTEDITHFRQFPFVSALGIEEALKELS